MLSTNFKEYLQQVRRYTADLSITSSKMSPYQKCQVLLSPFRSRKKEPNKDVTKSSFDSKQEGGMSNLAFATDTEKQIDQKQEEKDFPLTPPKTSRKIRDIRTSVNKKKTSKRVTFRQNPEFEPTQNYTKPKCDNHVENLADNSPAHCCSKTTKDQLTYFDDKCSTRNQPKVSTTQDKFRNDLSVCPAKMVTFEVERPDSISLTPGYNPLMDLASPLGLPSPTDDPLLYTRMLLSVAKCSTIIYHSR